MRIAEEQVGDAAVLHIDGELDERTAASLRDRLDDLIDRRGVRYLVLDIRQLTFIDSSGLGVLLGRFRRLQQRGGRMALVRPASHVKAVLELSGIPRLMPIYASARQALDGR